MNSNFVLFEPIIMFKKKNLAGFRDIWSNSGTPGQLPKFGDMSRVNGTDEMELKTSSNITSLFVIYFEKLLINFDPFKLGINKIYSCSSRSNQYIEFSFSFLSFLGIVLFNSLKNLDFCINCDSPWIDCSLSCVGSSGMCRWHNSLCILFTRQHLFVYNSTMFVNVINHVPNFMYCILFDGTNSFQFQYIRFNNENNMGNCSYLW